MKSYLDITGKYLKNQKKRTMVAVLGILLSTALFTGIGTLVMSMQDKMVRDAVSENGSWHVQIEGVTPQQAIRMRSHVRVKTAALYVTENPVTLMPLVDSKGVETPRVLSVLSGTTEGLDLLPVHLSIGRLPASAGEMVLDEQAMELLPNQVILEEPIEGLIGDESITIVGLLKPTVRYTGQTEFNAYVQTTDEELYKRSKLSLLMQYKKTGNTDEQTRSILMDVGLPADTSHTNNDSVLRLFGDSRNGNMNAAVISIFAFITGIVVICAIAVIYNVFHISVMERITQFGMLRCVGSTPKQIRRIVLKEALTLASAGIPIGILCGYGAMAVLFWLFRQLGDVAIFSDLRITTSFWVLGVSVLLGFLTVILSALGPANNAGHISPLEAVRATRQIRRESIRVRRSGKLVRKLFGIEAGLAWNNLHRNRTRFVITVFSMVISMVLYIVFQGFVDLTLESGYVGEKMEVSYMVNNSERPFTDDELMELRQLPGVSRILTNRNVGMEVVLPQNLVNDQLISRMPEGFSLTGADSAVFSDVTMLCVGDEAFSDLLPTGQTIDTLNAEDGVVIMPNTLLVQEGGNKTVVMDVLKADKVDSFRLGNSTFERDVQVAAVLKKGPLMYGRLIGPRFLVLVTEQQYAAWNTQEPLFSVYLRMEKGAELEPVSQSLKQLAEINQDILYADYSVYKKENNQMILILSIFLYGFVAVVSLIGCLNIVNTISTNLILRTHELSMMRAVGMTDEGMASMILFEGLFHGLVAAVFGGVAGTLLLRLLFGLMGILRELPFSIPWGSIAISSAGVLLITLLAVVAPLKRLNRGNIMEQLHL